MHGHCGAESTLIESVIASPRPARLVRQLVCDGAKNARCRAFLTIHFSGL